MTSRFQKIFRPVSIIVLAAAVIVCVVKGSLSYVKFYPVLINLVFLFAFGITLFFPPVMIFRFATLQDKTIKGSFGEKYVESYCRKVTIAWCGFFIFNGSVSVFTIIHGSDFLWTVYNGCVSYILIGIFFMGELAVRKMAQKKNPKAVPLSAIKNNSRLKSKVICYQGVFSGGHFKTWNDFLEGTVKLKRSIEKINSKSNRWLLYCEDYWYFLLAFTALLQCKKEILLSANISPDYIDEIRGCGGGNSGVPFLTDQVFPEEKDGIFLIADLLDFDLEKKALKEKNISIIPDDTSIVMYTSGSTGKPKEVKQRLTEFENDNKFVLSKWGEELLDRKLCSTVSQHHIYGLLYSVLLPFTAGIPFRRKRIEFPEELEKFNDDAYTLITVPAFLKRAVDIENQKEYGLKTPWIFTSGGVLDPQTAEKTNKILGFWPVEVYGSTETSGIAWRQSFNGLEWMPFENTSLSKNKDGCLVIKSLYIKDPEGFETQDMADILEDGRFLLKGRADSVVKIEEKRISLTEVENRILQSGLAGEACVISIIEKRQYLAAAVVLNEKGKNEFSNFEKKDINKYWREYLSKFFEYVVIPRKWRYLEEIPKDAQGKKKKEDIENIFRG